MLTAGLLAACLRAPDAALRKIGLQAGTLVGYDSNPLRLSDNRTAAAFSELRLDSVADLDVHQSAGFLIELHGRLRLHEQPAAGADYQQMDLRAGFDWMPYRSTSSHVAVALGGLYRSRRTTFLDPTSGQDYVLVEDPATTPPTTINLAERLDLDSAGAFLNMRWQTSRRLQFAVDSEYRRDDHRQDYRESPVVSSLDARRLAVMPGAVITLHNLARLRLAAGVTHLDYDERLALDSQGNEVPGTTRTYDYTTYRLALDLLPAPRWDLRLGLLQTARDDTFAGYYTFRQRSAWMSVRRPIGQLHLLQGYLSLGELNYATATVTGDPGGEVRSSEVLQFVGRYRRKMTSAWTLFVEGGFQKSTNPDPVYAYDRGWSLVGITFRH
ncbi:MAG: hypothetical protein O7D35_06480 [Acidobacteria bacterium]|nr:hypothetical protein [Acidobacteriota bacterium]